MSEPVKDSLPALQPEWRALARELLTDLDRLMADATVLPLNDEQLDVLEVGVGLAFQKQFIQGRGLAPADVSATAADAAQPPAPPRPDPGINPGIRAVVEWLKRHGFRTCDSGDGATHDYECDLPMPYVHMLVPKSRLVREADRLRALLAERGIQLKPMSEEGQEPCLQATYSPGSGPGTLSLFNVKW